MPRAALLALLFVAPALAEEPPLPAGSVARVGSTRLRHAAEVCALAYSADGKLLATAAADNIVLVHDAAKGEVRRRFTILPLVRPVQNSGPGAPPGPGGLGTDQVIGPGAEPAILRFSADGRELLVGGRGDVRAFRIDTGKPSHIHMLGTGEQCLAISSGLAIASVDNSFAVREYDRTSGHLRREQEIAGTLPVRAEFTPHGLLTSGRFVVRLFDPANGSKRGEWSWRDAGELIAATLAPDGKTIAVIVGPADDGWSSNSTAPKAGNLVLWDTREPTKRRTVPNVTAAECVAYAADGKSLAVACREGLLLIDPKSGKVLRTMAGAPRMTRLSFAPDGKTLAAASGMAVSQWNTTTGERYFASAEPASDVVRVRFLDSRRLLVFAGEIVEYDWRAGTISKRYPALPHFYPLADEVSPDRTTVVVCDEQAVRAIDSATSQVKWDAQTGRVERCGFSADSKRLAILGHGGFTVHDTQMSPTKMGDKREWQVDLTRAVSNLALSGDGTMVAGQIATRSDDDEPESKVISLWRARDGKNIIDLAPKVHSWGAPQFSPDGRRLATLAFVNEQMGDADGNTQWFLFVWDTDSGRLLRQVRGLRGASSGLALAPNGHSAAYGASDGSVRVLELSTDVERVHFAGHQREVRSIAFSPCGRFLASTSVDSQVFVWDLYAAPPGPSLAPARLWADLADERIAFLAMRRLAATPDTAVDLFRTHLRSIAPVAKERIQVLLTDLDSKRYAARQAALSELQRIVDQAEIPMRRHLGSPGTSIEARRQIQRLLDHMDEPTADFVVRLRALEVLEQINTPAARALVAEWAAGAPAARFTQEAKATLARMK
jgi:WD40 repeat protein